MKPHIFEYNKFNEELKNIIFKIPESRNHNITIPLKYKFESSGEIKPLLFKTPKIYMPFKPNISNPLGGYIRLSFDNLKVDHNLKDFYDFINHIETYLEKKMIEKQIINNMAKLIFKKTIKKSDGFPDYFNINFNLSDARCFDNNFKNIPLEEVNGNFYAYFIIELYGFYYNKKTKQIRLIWNLIQFKLDNTRQVINECLFLDEDISNDLNNDPNKNNIKNHIKENKHKLKDHPLLEKYFKMLLVGIPRPAIKHKLNLSGMDDRFIDFSPDSDIELLPNDLKNKLNINDNIVEKQNTNPLAGMIKKLDFTNLKLNKVSSTNPEKKIILIDKGLKVPSLIEIQEAHKKIFEKNNNIK
jgi:hypothetical protein